MTCLEASKISPAQQTRHVIITWMRKNSNIDIAILCNVRYPNVLAIDVVSTSKLHNYK